MIMAMMLMVVKYLYQLALDPPKPTFYKTKHHHGQECSTVLTTACSP